MRFGGAWGAPGCEEVPTPVGQSCIYCGDPIAEGDEGVVMPEVLSAHLESGAAVCRLVPEHRDCLLLHLFGSRPGGRQ